MREALEVSPLDYHSELTVKRDNIFAEDSYLSKSVLWELDSCSLFRWRFAPKEFKGNKAVDWGTMVDCLLTTPNEFDQITTKHDFLNFKTKAARELRDQAIKEGKALLSNDEYVELVKAVDKIKANREAAEIIDKSKSQVVLLGSFKGINFKGLVDLAPEGEPYLADIKTTGELSLDAISKRVASLGYHVQAGIYLALWNQMFPHDQRNRFRHIWQSQSAPYEVAVTELATVDINSGREYALFLLNKLIKATMTNKWPNICEDKVVTISRPQYAMYREEEKMDGLIEAPETRKREVS